MGRNAIPKISEWRDGALYEFSANGDGAVKPSDGRHIVYRVTRANGEQEILATCWADGFQECMAAMFEAGRRKGFQRGVADTKMAFRKILGVTE